MAASIKWEQIKSFLLLPALLLALPYSVYSQASYLPLNRDYNAIFETHSDLTSSGFHSSIRPFLKSDVTKHLNFDSVMFKATPGFMNFAMDSVPSNKQTSFSILPTFDLGYGRDLVAGKGYSVAGLGLAMQLDLGKKLTFQGAYTTVNRGFVNYVDSSIQSSEVVPAWGYAHPTKEGYSFSNFEGYISYSPSPYFNFQAGQGKNFFGNGYRSLLLSDVANNYPFLKISTNIWKIKYVNLYTVMSDVQGSGGNTGNFQRKYATFHYLSWNVWKWLNVSLFESIVWAGEDSSGVRGYDVNYLNPLIFYRPVEFSLGSSDNALIGTNIAVKLSKSLLVYGQVVLDEFFLVHIRARDGWWANKQGFQVGFKAWNLFGVEGLFGQLEYNWVRPYTYAHGLRIQNYSHFNQALAHPLGANFYETTSFLKYHKGAFTIEGSLMYAVVGTDSSGSNWGGNIFLDYSTPRQQEFDNYTGQGVKADVIGGGLRVAYMLYPPSNLKFEVGLHVRSSTSEISNNNSTLFTIGLRTDLGNTYHDF